MHINIYVFIYVFSVKDLDFKKSWHKWTVFCVFLPPSRPPLQIYVSHSIRRFKFEYIFVHFQEIKSP